MRNQAEIRADGMNVYLVSRVRAGNTGKAILTIVNLLVLAAYVYTLSYMQKHHIRAYLVPAVVSFVFLIFFPWRWWFWSCFGKEYLTINAETLDYFYDYGILKTKAASTPHLRLTVKYKRVKTINNEEYGRLHFISLNRDTAQRQEIYHTSVLIAKEDLLKMQEEIEAILNNAGGELLAAAG